MSKEVKWKCPKCGGSRFRVILEQIMSDVYNRDEEPKEWEFTDATIETQEAKMVQCMNCGTILKQIPKCPHSEDKSYEKYLGKRHKEALMKKPKEKLIDIIIQLEGEIEELGGDLEQISYD